MHGNRKLQDSAIEHLKPAVEEYIRERQENSEIPSLLRIYYLMDISKDLGAAYINGKYPDSPRITVFLQKCKLLIEACIEEKLSGCKTNPTGLIFVSKALHGWRDGTRDSGYPDEQDEYAGLTEEEAEELARTAAKLREKAETRAKRAQKRGDA